MNGIRQTTTGLLLVATIVWVGGSAIPCAAQEATADTLGPSPEKTIDPVAAEAIEPDRLTVEALFRADRVDGDLQHIVSVFDPWDDRAPYNPRQWTLEIHEGRLRFGIYGHDQRWHLVNSAEPLSRGWHHGVGTFDGRQVRLYLNGSMQQAPDDQSSGQFRGYINRPRPGAAKPPSAGSSAPLGHYGFQGAIARLRLRDQAMADDEIREAYRTACERVPTVARRAEDGCGVANE